MELAHDSNVDELLNKGIESICCASIDIKAIFRRRGCFVVSLFNDHILTGSVGYGLQKYVHSVNLLRNGRSN